MMHSTLSSILDTLKLHKKHGKQAEQQREYMKLWMIDRWNDTFEMGNRIGADSATTLEVAIRCVEQNAREWNNAQHTFCIGHPKP